MALIYQVANSLADQMVADGEASQAVTPEDLPLAPYVALVFDCLVYLEVIPPTGKLQAVVAHVPGERRELL